MQTFTRRGFALGTVLILALSAAACGDNEPEQRKAFMSFLQTRIVDKSGVHIPKLTDEEKKSFGPYVDPYAVIPGFSDNPELLDIAKKMQQATQTVGLTSVQALIDHRKDLKDVGDYLAKAQEVMARELTKTNAARAALKQPDDLKAVFDKAFDKDVTIPARGFIETMPIVVDIANAALKLVDYIESHRATVNVSARSVGGKDPQTAKDLEVLVKDLQRLNTPFEAARRRMNAALNG